MRKAGYPQNTIDSVDIIKKANNKRYVFYVVLGIFLIVLCFLFFNLKTSDSSSAENAIFELASEPVIVNDNGSVSIDMKFKRYDFSDLEERIIFDGLFNKPNIESNLDCEPHPLGFSCILNKEKEFYLRISEETDKTNFAVYQLLCNPKCDE